MNYEHKKSVENLPVVHSTHRGSSIAYLSWTDNVRAHADMINRLRVGFCASDITPKKENNALHETTRLDIITPESIYRCYVRDLDIEFARFDVSRTKRQVNAFIMSCLFTHPHLLICESDPQKGSACAEAYESIGMKHGNAPIQIFHSKVTTNFSNKENFWKKMLKSL